MKKIHSLFLTLSLAACASTPVSNSKTAEELTASTYEKEKNTKGVVIMDINWDRQWPCAGFENAGLVSIGFARLPLSVQSKEEGDAEILFRSSITAKKGFNTYAVLVQPGKYALSYYKIKTARSVNDVGFFTATENDLIRSGEGKAGFFTVEAGESVYIGNFFIDCALRQPVPWRYYIEGRNDFNTYLDRDVVGKYPFLDREKIKYRLFETTIFGNPYELE